MWASILAWLKDNQVGDLTGVLGIVISLIGFWVTVAGVVRSHRAAEQAAAAARSARESIRLFDTVVDFSSAIATLEEIKRAHRQAAWSMLPDRYAAIRKLLITLRAANGDLSEGHLSLIQNAIANLQDIEASVERALISPGALKPAKFNALLSEDIDNLVAVLTELKASKTGERNGDGEAKEARRAAAR